MNVIQRNGEKLKSNEQDEKERKWKRRSKSNK